MFTHSLGNVNIALFVIGILAALIGFMARPGGVDLKGHPEVARIAIGALALGALWIAGLHFWSVILVVVFVIVGFAAVARAEQLDKGEPPSSPEPPVARAAVAARAAGQLDFGADFFLSGAICEPSSWPMSTPFSKCTQ